MEFNENETQMNNISELPAGCYLVYVIDALGNQVKLILQSLNPQKFQIINDDVLIKIMDRFLLKLTEEPHLMLVMNIYMNGVAQITIKLKNISQLSSGNTLLVKDSNNYEIF